MAITFSVRYGADEVLKPVGPWPNSLSHPAQRPRMEPFFSLLPLNLSESRPRSRPCIFCNSLLKPLPFLYIPVQLSSDVHNIAGFPAY